MTETWCRTVSFCQTLVQFDRCNDLQPDICSLCSPGVGVREVNRCILEIFNKCINYDYITYHWLKTFYLICTFCFTYIVSISFYICLYTSLYLSIYFSISVYILLYICPYTSLYLSIYFSISVYILLSNMLLYIYLYTSFYMLLYICLYTFYILLYLSIYFFYIHLYIWLHKSVIATLIYSKDLAHTRIEKIVVRTVLNNP